MTEPYLHNMTTTTYCQAIREGFAYILRNNPKSFVMGQGVWSPWYVGNSMKNLEAEFGTHRVIDTPISELATTGAAIGAGLHGYCAIIVHPRMDFMLLAADQIVNQAAKWRHMLGGAVSPNLVIRAVINRGGEQGAQHSQALHSWFAHIPGLRVLMPATATDARDFLIAAAQSKDPVMYIDDRWCYDYEEVLPEAKDIDIKKITPKILCKGTDISIAAVSHSVNLCKSAAAILDSDYNISCEIIDVRQLNPIKPDIIIQSAKKTGRFLAVDGGWSNCGFASELLAQVSENVSPTLLHAKLSRITLPDAPAPSSQRLEQHYYTKVQDIVNTVVHMVS
jgi:acetoin:2,6-dichlorophenolindophenol oxidoreductase subunit beta